MKSLLALLFAVSSCYYATAQSFSTSVYPTGKTIIQGDTTGFNVSVGTTGGFNSSIYFQLILPNCLNGSVALSNTSLNTPYLGLRILVSSTGSIPAGTHPIILKSYNGTIIDHDTVFITVLNSINSLWRVYKKHNSPMGLETNVTSVLIDGQGDYWAASRGGMGSTAGALMCLSGDRWYVWSMYGYQEVDLCGVVQYTSTQNIAGVGIDCLAKHGDTVYASSSNRVYKIVNKVLTALPALPQQHTAISMASDNNNRVWAVTVSSGYYFVYKFDGNNWLSFNLSTAPFSSSLIECIEFDYSGSIWFATSGGLHKYDGQFWTSFGSSAGLTTNSFYTVKRSRNGTIWAGSGNNGTVFKFNATTASFTAYNFSTSGSVETIDFDKDNNPLVAGNVGLARLNGSSWTWFSSSNSPVQNYTGSGLPAIAWAAAIDSLEHMLVANGSGGFLIWDNSASLVADVPSIEINSSPDYLIFPNPSIGNFSIFSADPTGVYTVSVIDVAGKERMRLTTTETVSKISLDPGFYIVRIVDGYGRRVDKKVIVGD